MKDILSVYLEKSSCNMENCHYGFDVECSGCNKKMVDEHDNQIREYILNAIKNDLYDRLVEEQNNPYQDQSLCEGLYFAIKRCDWYLSDDNENKEMLNAEHMKDLIRKLDDYDYTQREVIDMAYQQGRADAIDEYKNALHKEFEKADKKLLHWIDFVEMYNKVAEQLKENNNEH